MQNTNSKVVKYPLASAGRRILAKVIDIAIISCLVLALGFTIFCTDPNFKWNEQLNIAGWRYGLFVTLMALIFFSLMLLLPRLWNKTIGMKALKLAYFKKEECNHTFALFKHELFIWEIIVIIAFAMGCTLSGLTAHQIDSLVQGANAIFANKMPEGLDKACYYAGTGFSCMYGICIIFLVAIIISICIRNKKPAFHDKYSHIYVIHKQSLDSQYRSVNSIQDKDDTKVPGQISDESLEEIDNI